VRTFIIILGFLFPTLLYSEAGFEFGCDQMESSFAEHNKRSTLIGNAYVITGSLNIKSDKIELYGQDYRFAQCSGGVVTLIQIKVRIINEDLVCRSDFAEYNSDKNTLVLTGDPIVYKGNDVFRASKINIDLDNNDIVMEGNVKGNITDKEKAEKKTEE